MKLHFRQPTQLVALLSVLATTAYALSVTRPDTDKLQLPAGFKIEIFAKLSVPPRMLAMDKQGNLYASSAQSGQVFMLPDANKDGRCDAPVLIAEHLNAPNGLAFADDDLLIANQDGIVKLRKNNGAWSAPSPLVSHLATGGHTLKSVKVGPDGYLYVNVGSSCNICVEEDPTRATILRYTLEGKPAGGLEIVGRHNFLAPVWASGLRNSQGFTWHPKTGAMFATNEGDDNRSDIKGGKVNDELPPEHLNRIEPGKHYGWPYCWGDPNKPGHLMQDPNFVGNPSFCETATAPALMLTSHSTPIGITFLDKSNFPAEYKTDAIVALHGSWNRAQPSGYKLVRIKFDDDKPIASEDFVTGWLVDKEAWGRPVDVIVGQDGALYVSDDKSNNIYRITYTSHK
jgi:glucose/arabinose dehydrogenase